MGFLTREDRAITHMWREVGVADLARGPGKRLRRERGIKFECVK